MEFEKILKMTLRFNIHDFTTVNYALQVPQHRRSLLMEAAPENLLEPIIKLLFDILSEFQL